MSSAVSHEVAAYVPGGGELWRSPWAAYAALRDLDPVHHVVPEGRPHADYYVLSRHADVLEAAVDTATYSSAQGLTVEYGEMERIGLTDADLLRPITVPRRNGYTYTPAPRLLAHLFQHQIHHRGQAHAMLSGTPVAPPQLDDFFCIDDAPRRAPDLAALGFTEAMIFGE